MNSRRTVILVHAAVWIVCFISPLMFMNHGNGISLPQFLGVSMVPLSIMGVFYANYLWLAPRYFAAGNKKIFFIANGIIILVVGIGLHIWMGIMHQMFDKRPPGPSPSGAMFVFMILRNMFNLAVSAAIATTIQLSMRWQASENARREAEAARTNAELKNLRSQVNPHFLLNTLNNIYALAEFSPHKAQETIQELSKLLRHLLYDNQQEFIPLKSEVEFLTNYINLMKIRLATNVEVKFTAALPDSCDVMIAPLTFMSLIENAFKHGVSSTAPSFIHICIAANESAITCNIENSNYPKDNQDRSGHGIGLKNVDTRLRLLYPGKYKWSKGIDKERNVYYSKITIYDTKLCNNR